MANAAVPGPRLTWPWSALRQMRRDPLRFLTEVASYGPVAQFRVGGQKIFLISDPAGVEDVLVTHASSFKKGRALERAKRTLGEGLLTSEGAAHLRQRRLMQPAFHRGRIAQYGDAMARAAAARREHWQADTPFDLALEMNRLTLAIVSETLFGANVGTDSDTARVQRAVTDVMEMVDLVLVPFGDWLLRLPLPRMRRFLAAQQSLDRLIYEIVESRRNSPGDHTDLLALLLEAQDAEGDGTGMSDTQVHDEVITLFLAGHETTANALTWAWVLLARHPDVERHVHHEIDAVLDGRVPAAADVPRLPYTRAVIAETMRLYPPAWTVGRRALVDYHWGGCDIPAGSIVLMSQWVMHRDPAYWPDPERFDPGRWLPESARPRFAYFPFGGGNRMCIGDHFAWTEAILVLATIGQAWRIRLDPLHAIEPQPLITLRTRDGVRATARRRGSGTTIAKTL